VVYRRIGLSVHYIALQMRQAKHDRDTIILVRGRGPPLRTFRDGRPGGKANLETDALLKFRELNQLYRETAGRA